jgi:hypothetical protein
MIGWPLRTSRIGALLARSVVARGGWRVRPDLGGPSAWAVSCRGAASEATAALAAEPTGFGRRSERAPIRRVGMSGNEVMSSRGACARARAPEALAASAPVLAVPEDAVCGSGTRWARVALYPATCS